jgi:hypothetical protein
MDRLHLILGLFERRGKMPAPRSPVREHSGLSLGIAAVLVIFFVLIPALLVGSIYLLLTIYAIVKWIGSAPDGASALTVLLSVILLVTAWTLVIGGAVSLAGRAMNPRRR